MALDTIDSLTLDLAGQGSSGSGPVDYWDATTPLDVTAELEPFENLATRDNILSKKVTEIIDAFNKIESSNTFAPLNHNHDSCYTKIGHSHNIVDLSGWSDILSIQSKVVETALDKRYALLTAVPALYSTTIIDAVQVILDDPVTGYSKITHTHPIVKPNNVLVTGLYFFATDSSDLTALAGFEICFAEQGGVCLPAKATFTSGGNGKLRIFLPSDDDGNTVSRVAGDSDITTAIQAEIDAKSLKLKFIVLTAGAPLIFRRTTFNITGQVGTYSVGETVKDSTSVWEGKIEAISGAKLTIINSNGFTGALVAGNIIVGQTSGATGEASGVLAVEPCSPLAGGFAGDGTHCNFASALHDHDERYLRVLDDGEVSHVNFAEGSAFNKNFSESGGANGISANVAREDHSHAGLDGEIDVGDISADNIVSGVMNIARIPVGPTVDEVSRGNHTHPGEDVVSGKVDTDRLHTKNITTLEFQSITSPFTVGELLTEQDPNLATATVVSINGLSITVKNVTNSPFTNNVLVGGSIAGLSAGKLRAVNAEVGPVKRVSLANHSHDEFLSVTNFRAIGPLHPLVEMVRWLWSPGDDNGFKGYVILENDTHGYQAGENDGGGEILEGPSPGDGRSFIHAIDKNILYLSTITDGPYVVGDPVAGSISGSGTIAGGLLFFASGASTFSVLDVIKGVSSGATAEITFIHRDMVTVKTIAGGPFSASESIILDVGSGGTGVLRATDEFSPAVFTHATEDTEEIETEEFRVTSGVRNLPENHNNFLKGLDIIDDVTNGVDYDEDFVCAVGTNTVRASESGVHFYIQNGTTYTVKRRSGGDAVPIDFTENSNGDDENYLVADTNDYDGSDGSSWLFYWNMSTNVDFVAEIHKSGDLEGITTSARVGDLRKVEFHTAGGGDGTSKVYSGHPIVDLTWAVQDANEQGFLQQSLH